MELIEFKFFELCTVVINQGCDFERRKFFVVVQIRKADDSEGVCCFCPALTYKFACGFESSTGCDEVVNQKEALAFFYVGFMNFNFGTAIFKIIRSSVNIARKLSLFSDKHEWNSKTFAERSGKNEPA